MSSPEEIPVGDYCYTRLSVNMTTSGPRLGVKPCPYWSLRADQPEQMNGHCAYLGLGDWEYEGLGLLWDSVKMCGLKMNEEGDVE